MNLKLSLKKKWFEMTKAGIKNEDYREITTYWSRRLVDGFDGFKPGGLPKQKFKKFKTNKMTLGYPKKDDHERILVLEHKGIKIGYGKPEWGAEPGRLYFVIKHGKRIEIEKEDD